MNKANVNDRASVERIYGPDAWEQDASRNSRGNAAVVYGLKILSGPDSDGAFALARTSQHVGEGDREGDAVFLAAFDADAAATASDEGTYGGSAGPMPDANDDSDYRRFIDNVLEAARTAHFKPAIGKDDDRIKGFRGG
jgi:hypothetical protein